VEAIAQFAFAPVWLNRRPESVWADARAHPMPEPLAIRISQHRSRGRIPSFEREFADRQTWFELLLCLGIEPQKVDRRVESLGSPQARRILDTIRRDLDATLRVMPTVAEFHRRFDQR
jgi:hypothetical protein